MKYFNIQVASQLSGVASATIRAWEKRYHAVNPERAENKHRLYSETDIEKLALLYKLTELGQSIGKIAHLGLTDLKDVYSKLMHRPYEETYVVTPHHEKIDIDKILSNLFLALAAYKIDIISHELEKIKSILSPREICLDILVPLFQEIGNKVLKNEITIAQEHTLSAIVSFHMGQLIGLHYQKSLKRNDLVLITTPEGEMHGIGILAASLLCIHYGVKFIFLGPNLPAESLAQAANALNPKAILIGVTRQDVAGQPTLNEFLLKLKSQLNNNPELWLGGNVKSVAKTDMEKKKIQLFPSLHAFDTYLEKF